MLQCVQMGFLREHRAALCLRPPSTQQYNWHNVVIVILEDSTRRLWYLLQPCKTSPTYKPTYKLLPNQINNQCGVPGNQLTKVV